MNFLWFLKGKSKKRREKKKEKRKKEYKREEEKQKKKGRGRVPTLPQKIIRGPTLAHFYTGPL